MANKIDLIKLADDADKCVQCGLCVPLCPTWQISHNEALSPRGRIIMMAALARGDKVNGADDALGSCLGCGICQQVCPSNVPFLDMIGAGKKLAKAKLGFLGGLIHKLALMPMHNFILHTLLSAARMLNLFIPLALMRIIPRHNSSNRKIKLPTNPTKQAALFTGCFGDTLDGKSLAAAKILLAGADYKLNTPTNQTCCGGLAKHSGDEATVSDCQQRNRKAFAGQGPIITTASGCTANLVQQQLGEPVIEASEFLLKNLSALKGKPANADRLQVVLHLPCSHQLLKRPTAAIELLQQLPGVEVLTIGKGTCCGAGGLTNLKHNDQAITLSTALTKQMIKSSQGRKTSFCSLNHACARQLERTLTPHSTVPIRHPLEIFLDKWNLNALAD